MCRVAWLCVQLHATMCAHELHIHTHGQCVYNRHKYTWGVYDRCNKYEHEKVYQLICIHFLPPTGATGVLTGHFDNFSSIVSSHAVFTATTCQD